MDAPRIDFPPMEGAPALARWLGLAPRFDVMAAMNAVTMEIVAKTLFGADVSSDIGAVAQAVAVLGEETGRVRPTAFFDLPEFVTRPRGGLMMRLVRR